LLASLTVPPLVERLRLPGLVGLLLAGIVLGPHGLRLLDADTETVKLLSDIGKVYLMFVAGLEIDMRAFHKTRDRSLTFGFLTFAIPLMTGTGLGFALGMGWNTSLLLGSLLASHTLLAYPLLQRLGVVRNEAVVVSVGATIFTDIGALLVLAICISVHQGEFTWFRLGAQLAALGLYATAVLVGFNRLGKAYFRRTGKDEGSQFLFTLLVLFLASVGAQVIHTENIVGAFLAGLAVSDVLGKSAVKEKVEFVGSVLFIPFFFIAMGLLIDIPVFVGVLLTNIGIVVAIVASLVGSKFLAAWCVQRLYRYPWPETLTMWSLSLPQVAATLAAALVGYQAGLLSEVIFNSVIVLMLVTSTLGPLLTRRYASQLVLAQPLFSTEAVAEAAASGGFNVVVPVHNPDTEPYLVEMAGRLAQQQQGNLFPLAIAQPAASLKEAAFLDTLAVNRQRLAQAFEIGQRLGVPTQPILRVDREIAAGICHSSSEQSAQLTVMGYGDMFTLQTRLLGSVVEQVFHWSPSAVAVMRLRLAPLELTRVVVPLWEPGLGSNAHIRFAQQVAIATQTKLTVLYCAPPPLDHSQAQQQLTERIRTTPGHPQIQTVATTNVAAAVLEFSQTTDLVLLPGRELIPVWELPTDDWGAKLLETLTCSVALFKEAAA
ncbi:MAG: cation:proton antiporter, partial [Cyanobacteria bacterium P01_A01_bin.17]